MTATFPEQRAAGEKAAADAVNEARGIADESLVLRKWMLLCATYGHDSPAVLAFLTELAKLAVFE